MQLSSWKGEGKKTEKSHNARNESSIPCSKQWVCCRFDASGPLSHELPAVVAGGTHNGKKPLLWAPPRGYSLSPVGVCIDAQGVKRGKCSACWCVCAQTRWGAGARRLHTRKKGISVLAFCLVVWRTAEAFRCPVGVSCRRRRHGGGLSCNNASGAMSLMG